jgi:hypothetical protein
MSTKETLIIYPHFKLSDLLNILPAVEHYSKKYIVTIVILKEHLNNAKLIFEDVDDIKFYPIEKPVYYPDNKDFYNYLNSMYKEKKLIGHHNVSGSDISDQPFCDYKDLELDISIYNDYKINKDHVNKESSRLKGVEYVFISLRYSDFTHQFNPGTNKIVICPETNFYEPKHPYYDLAKLYIGLPYLEYVDIIEGASEIYVVDDAYFYLAIKCDLTASIRTCFCRNGVKHENLSKKFKYEFIKGILSLGLTNDSPFVNGINRNVLLQKMGRR